MLPRIHRLPSRERLTSPRTFTTPFCTLRVSSSHSTVSRAKVVISKKIDKRSVRRNLLRRQIHTVLEEELPKHTKPLDLVFILKPAVVQMQPDVLREEVRILLSKTVQI